MTSPNDISDIDRAIQAAKARKAARANGGSAPPAPPPVEGSDAAPKTRRPRLTTEQKAQRDAQRAQEAATRKQERAERKATKQAARSKPTAHLAKVEKAATKLAPKSSNVDMVFNEATANLSASDIANLIAHLSHFNRFNSTVRALATQLSAGQRVTVIGGDPRYVGRPGTLDKVSRIRCTVQIDGVTKSQYLFTSDVALLDEANVAQSATA
jgi:hypothetical protein